MMSLALLIFAQVASGDITVAPKDWQIVKRDSGPVNYYSVVTENGETFLRSNYTSPNKTSVVGWQTPDADRDKVKKIKWKWRAQTLPTNGDECASGKEDSAAVVYLTFKRGLRYYTLKYVWSAVGTKGKVCDSKRNPFVAQDTIILRTGASGGTWYNEEIDLAAEYRKHFEGGDAKASVPAFVGIGLMSDGDQTQSTSSADFGNFTVVR